MKILKIASTPKEIDKMIKEAAQELRDNPPNYPDPMLPPWEYAPSEPMASMFWRMGGGEDYIMVFIKWFHKMDALKQKEYVLLNPADPEDWPEFYDMVYRINIK